MSKKSKPKTDARFYVQDVELNKGDRTPVFRETEISSYNLPYARFTRTITGEVVEVKVFLTSSGNTTTMSDAEICAWVMNKINS